MNGSVNLGTTDEGRWPANVILDEQAGAMVDAQSGSTHSTVGAPRTGQPGNGYGMTHTGGEYADFGGASRFFYCAKASTAERNAGCDEFERQKVDDGRTIPADNAYQRGDTLRLNVHPTVKPLELTEYIARLILPPKRETDRRLLVPFSGSGSEMIRALKAGWDFVQGVELSADYAEIAGKRIKAHTAQQGFDFS